MEPKWKVPLKSLNAVSTQLSSAWRMNRSTGDHYLIACYPFLCDHYHRQHDWLEVRAVQTVPLVEHDRYVRKRIGAFLTPFPTV